MEFTKALGKRDWLAGQGDYYVYKQLGAGYAIEGQDCRSLLTRKVGLLPAGTEVVIVKIMREERTVGSQLSLPDSYYPIVSYVDPDTGKQKTAKTSFYFLRTTNKLNSKQTLEK